MNKKVFAMGFILALSFQVIVSSEALAKIRRNSMGPDIIAHAPKSLDVEFNDVDVLEALRELSIEGGLNIAVGPHVSGRVTLFLKSVSALDALKALATSQNLTYSLIDGMIHVMTPNEYESIYGARFLVNSKTSFIDLKYINAFEAAEVLKGLKSDSGRIVAEGNSNSIVLFDQPAAMSDMKTLLHKMDRPKVTEVIELQYIDAANVSKTTLTLLTPGIGSLHINEEVNSIVVTDYSTVIDKIRLVLRQLDKKPRQILIESKILSVTLPDKYKSGVNWQSIVDSSKAQVSDAESIEFGMSDFAFDMRPMNTGVVAYDKELLIEALKSVGEVDVLSNPRITIMNNQMATMAAKETIPYTLEIAKSNERRGRFPSELQFINVGIQIDVTPRINGEGNIVIQIHPEISFVEENHVHAQLKDNAPIVATLEAEASVIMRDGETLILSGLFKEGIDNVIYNTPFFSDIPLVGGLFRSKVAIPKKKEFIIMMTTTIIQDAESELKWHSMFDNLKSEKDIRPNMNRNNVDKRTRDNAPQNKLRKVSFAASMEEYYIEIRNEIIQHLKLDSRFKALSSGIAELEFELNKDGSLYLQPSVLYASSDGLAAVGADAIMQAAPFMAFPASEGKQKETFKIKLECR